MSWVLIAIALVQSVGMSGQGCIGARLKVDHPRIAVAQPLVVHFEISNESGHDLYVCRKILVNSNWPCNLEIWIEGPDGKRYMTARTAIAQGRTDTSETVSDVMSKSYFLLPADYSYGSTITLNSSYGLNLKPCKCKIRAKYVSLNLQDSLGWFNAHLSDSADIPKLRDREWSGEVEAVSVPIEIVP